MNYISVIGLAKREDAIRDRYMREISVGVLTAKMAARSPPPGYKTL